MNPPEFRSAESLGVPESLDSLQRLLGTRMVRASLLVGLGFSVTHCSVLRRRRPVNGCQASRRGSRRSPR